MWQRIKNYLSFCGLAFIEKFQPVWRNKPMKILYIIVGFIIVEILNLFFGYPLWQLIKPIYQLLPSQTWIIFLLVFIIFILMMTLDGARQFHERTVRELNINHYSEISGWQTHTDRIRRLSIAFSAAREVLDIINSSGGTVSKDALQRLDSNIKNDLLHCLGNSGRDDYYADMPRFPEGGGEWVDWLGSHCTKLEELIVQERERQSPGLEKYD